MPVNLTSGADSCRVPTLKRATILILHAARHRDQKVIRRALLPGA